MLVVLLPKIMALLIPTQFSLMAVVLHAHGRLFQAILNLMGVIDSDLLVVLTMVLVV